MPETESQAPIHTSPCTEAVLHKEEADEEIQVNPKSRLSLQSHSKRSEVWTVIKGEALVTIDSETFLFKKNESAYIPPESMHRLENQLEKPLSIIEIQTGSYFGEDDIKRYEDDYNRS